MAESLGLPDWFRLSSDSSSDPKIHFILGTGVEVAGKILNISRVGVHAHVPVRFADGALLTFRVHGSTAKGQVLYCRPDGERFYMGISTGGERRREPISVQFGVPGTVNFAHTPCTDLCDGFIRPDLRSSR